MPTKRFTLNISASDYQAYYSGAARSVVTTTLDGLQIQFPASELRNFVSHSGVHGIFEITYSRENKLTRLRKLN